MPEAGWKISDRLCSKATRNMAVNNSAIFHCHNHASFGANYGWLKPQVLRFI